MGTNDYKLWPRQSALAEIMSLTCTVCNGIGMCVDCGGFRDVVSRCVDGERVCCLLDRGPSEEEVKYVYMTYT